MSEYVKPDFTLTNIFIVLKYLGLIDWSWWGVLSPLWVPALILILKALRNVRRGSNDER